MITLKHDPENGSERWWDAAQTLAARQWWTTFARVFKQLLAEAEVTVSAAEADEFRRTAVDLPGWTGGGCADSFGAPFGAHPVLFTEE
jgi:hypothetical protein